MTPKAEREVLMTLERLANAYVDLYYEATDEEHGKPTEPAIIFAKHVLAKHGIKFNIRKPEPAVVDDDCGM